MIQRHNEIKDSLGDVCAMVFPEVVREPIVREADEENGTGSLVADLGVRGLWQSQIMGAGQGCFEHSRKSKEK